MYAHNLVLLNFIGFILLWLTGVHTHVRHSRNKVTVATRAFQNRTPVVIVHHQIDSLKTQLKNLIDFIEYLKDKTYYLLFQH